MSETLSARWIGPPPSPLSIFLLLFVGSVGILVAGLQPILLGGLQAAHRLNLNEVGAAGAIELLTLGLSAGVASALLPPRHIRLVGCIASLAMAAANLATLGSSGPAIVAWRGVAGAAEGVMMWLPALLITRAALPERWEAIFLTVQTLAQLAIAAFVPLVARHGQEGDTALLIMTGCAVAAALAAMGGPKALQALPRGEASARARFNPRAVLALASVFTFLAFISGVWVYVESIGLQSGQSATIVGYATALSLGVQIIGGATAAVIGRRLPYVWVFAAAGAISLALVAILSGRPSALVFLTVIAVHGFLWLFVMPFQAPLLIDVDPTRRLAMYLGPTQILGASAGPYVASLFVTEQNPRAALVVGAVFIALSLLALLVLRTAFRRPAENTEPA